MSLLCYGRNYLIYQKIFVVLTVKKRSEDVLLAATVVFEFFFRIVKKVEKHCLHESFNKTEKNFCCLFQNETKTKTSFYFKLKTIFFSFSFLGEDFLF